MEGGVDTGHESIYTLSPPPRTALSVPARARFSLSTIRPSHPGPDRSVRSPDPSDPDPSDLSDLALSTRGRCELHFCLHEGIASRRFCPWVFMRFGRKLSPKGCALRGGEAHGISRHILQFRTERKCPHSYITACSVVSHGPSPSQGACRFILAVDQNGLHAHVNMLHLAPCIRASTSVR